jgi:hypothetical protein
VDRLDLQQGFADLRAPIGQDGSVTFRGGRQEMLFGSARLVDISRRAERRLSFDGGRAFYQSPNIRVDAFVVRPVVPKPGVFDYYSDPGRAFWGLYSVMPVRPVPGLTADLYYRGLDRRNAAFDSGVANQTVHSVGTRLWGQAGAWDYNTEGVFQFRSFGARDIRAWTIASNTGYTIGSLRGQPRLGL